MSLKITIWHEYRHEHKNPGVAQIYPKGMHEAIAEFLRKSGDLEVSTATLDEPEAGLTEEKLKNTDVLIWWGHMAHSDVTELVVERVYDRLVRKGMGLVVLHSGHFSKIFKKLMGTTCDLKWRDNPGDKETLWVTQPNHPIVRDVPDHFILEKEEMYGEYFDIPQPESVFLISSFSGGEVFRSGCTWTRGNGKVVYFRPGHETFPSYHNPHVLKVIENSARWAAPTLPAVALTFGRRDAGWIESK